MSEPIVKKTWPEFFELMVSGKKNVDVRLADFDLKEGDEILFREYCPKSKDYTGRSIVRKVKNFVFVNFSQFNTVGDILVKGHYIMEFERGTDFTFEELEEIAGWCEGVERGDMPWTPRAIHLYNEIKDIMAKMQEDGVGGRGN